MSPYLPNRLSLHGNLLLCGKKRRGGEGGDCGDHGERGGEDAGELGLQVGKEVLRLLGLLARGVGGWNGKKEHLHWCCD